MFRRWRLFWDRVIRPSFPFYLMLAVSPAWCGWMVTDLLTQSPRAWEDVCSAAILAAADIFAWVAGIAVARLRWQEFLDDCLFALGTPPPPVPPTPTS